MAWTDVLTDVPWSNGDFLTALKLGQMVANDRWAQDQVSFEHLGQASFPLTVAEPSEVYGTKIWRLQLYVDGSAQWTSANITSTTGVTVDGTSTAMPTATHGTVIDIALVSSYSSDGGSSWSSAFGTSAIKMVVTQAIEYLSHWTRAYVIQSGDYEMLHWDNKGIIAHRESQAW